MALVLSTPACTQSLAKDIETNPKKARAWIESLPLTKTVASVRIVTDNIRALNRAKLPADERVELLEVYRPVIAVLLDELDAVYAYSVLPMPQKQLEAFALAQDLLAECAHSYKLLLLEKTGKLLMFNAKKHLPLPLYRAMSCLSSLMLQGYKTYHPVPPGVWQDFHALYQCAVEQNLCAEIVDEDSKQSIGELYIASLLISLADPYRLMHKEVERVVQILSQNRGLATIRDNADGLDPQRLFVVALDSDQAPKVLVQGTRPTGQVLRLVDSTRLVARLEERLKAAGSGASAAKSHATHDLNDLMSRLIRLWGDPPKRQFRRNPAETGVALCSSIKGIAYFAELAANENPEADAAAIRDGRTIPLLKIPQDPMSQLIGVEEWQVLNQSANGLRMHRESGGNVGIAVGEVVGVRFVGGRAWNVGVVRWLSMLDGDALEFGLELISPAATSITIEPTIGSAKTMPALLIAPLMGDADADTIMTSTETFADLREYELVDHGDIRHVRATTLIERTSRFDLFQFQPS